MGKSITYCYKCSSLLREDDFQRGNAFQEGNRVVCVKCAPGLRGSTTKISAKATTALRTPSTRRIPVAQQPQEPEEFEAPPPPRSKLPLLLGAAGGGVVLIVVVILLLLPGKPTPLPPPTEEKVAETPKEKPRPKVVRTLDQQLLDEARKFAADHADDLGGQIEAYQKVVWKFEKGDSATEAKREIATLKEKIAGKVNAGLAELEREIEEPLKQESFGATIKIVDAAAGRVPGTEWKLAVDRRSREIFDRAKALATGLAKQAEALVAEGKKAEADAIVKRVRGWELPQLLEKIEEAVGTAAIAPGPDPLKAATALPVEKTPRSAEGKGYLEKWEQAMVRVAARDYAAAIAELERTGAGLKEAEVQGEAKTDVEDLRRLQTFVKETLDEAVAKPRPGMSLELRDGRKVAGRVVQIDADRVELGSKETVFAEWSEVSAASLAAIAWKKPEPRLAALLCLAEGDLEPAKVLLGAPLDTVPPKYWAWALGAKAKVPKAEGLEASSREIFYAAEREFRSMQTRGLAVEKYKSLTRDFAGSSVVRRASARIERRAEAGKEYFLAPADFEVDGTIKRSKAGRLESDADTDGNFAIMNWAEAEFYAMPGTAYRAWIQVGGCCAETFSFLWQATELKDISPSTRKPIAIEPGSRAAVTVKHSIKALKPTHDPKTPKTAARWEWVELSLPKYSGPGPKRFRFMTDQKGFSIGALLVSSLRKAPPKEDEFKELEKARVQDVPPNFGDPDLVVYWAFEEGSGAAVEDLSGNGHTGTLAGKAIRAAGKIGGGLEFQGGDGALTSPDKPVLRLTGDITIAFWVKKNAPAGDWQRMVGKGDERIRNYGVWTGGNGNKVLWQQYNQEGVGILQVTSAKDLPVGQWAHVAVTMEGSKGTVYIDGAKDGEGTRSGAPGVGAFPLTLATSNHLALVGALDDVRIYKRSLTAVEVRGLFEMGK